LQKDKWYTKDTISQVTTVKIEKETKKILAKLGGKDKSYDNIIKRLIYFYRKDTKGLGR